MPKQRIQRIKVLAIIATLGIALILFLLKSNNPDPWIQVESEAITGSNQETLVEEKTSPQPAIILVEISGEVYRPYVYSLPSDSHVIHGIEAAGGLTDEADCRDVNLAAPLCDGMKVYIPSHDEILQREGETGVKAGTTYVGGSNLPTANYIDPLENRVDINSAGSSELQTLNGVGPATAQSILEYRSEKGLFEELTDLKKVSGIGEKTFDKLKDHIMIRK